MRADMAEVIVERPHYGCRLRGAPKGAHRREQRAELGELPRGEGIRKRWRSWRKYLHGHLGPLRRYLRKQVGRPWDEVFAEITAHLHRDSLVQAHVLDRVLDFVQRHV